MATSNASRANRIENGNRGEGKRHCQWQGDEERECVNAVSERHGQTPSKEDRKAAYYGKPPLTQ